MADDLKKHDRMQALRERLYSRGNPPQKIDRHSLTDEDMPVARSWSEQTDTPKSDAVQADTRAAMPSYDTEELPKKVSAPLATDAAAAPDTPMPENRPKRTYRLVIVLLSLFVFIVVAGFSSMYLFFGGNQISGRNIDVTVTGPFSLSGGDVLPLQIGVTNQNSVPIESVNLIISYPSGTRSTDDSPRDLYEERIPLDDIGPGEAVNIPVRVAVFGEENEEKTVNATIEYRLKDSNGTFYKDATPLSFQVKSAALVIGVETVEKVASGQEIDITLNVRSNSPTTLTDILVSADYPDAFDFTSSSPEPVYGQNAWLIEELEPEANERITIRGVLIGLVEEEAVINFEAGKPQEDNQFIMGAILAKSDASFVIERPFINVRLAVGGDRSDGEVVVLPYGREPNINVTLENTLIDPIYDMSVEVSVSGNTINERNITVNDGFYNSIKDVVRWDVTSNNELTEVPAGSNRSLSFGIEPNAIAGKASMQVEASVYARRVLDNQVSEELIGFAKKEVRFTSSVSMQGSVGRNTSSFGDTGSVPPVAEEVTTYTITLDATAGANDMTDAVMTTSLPQYVEWLNKVDGYGDIEYNPVSKQITWQIGDIESNDRVRTSFQIALLPSRTQIGRTPALVGEQQLRATDRFTSAVVRASNLPLNTTLPESDYGENNGRVEDNE